MKESKMALSRSEAEKHGLAFSVEGETRPESPDQEVYEADLTIDGHTERFAGKSEEDVLNSVEKVLIARGKLGPKNDGVGEAKPTVAQQSDVEDLKAFLGQRDETYEELGKQEQERGIEAPVSPGAQVR
jgi:hypothetical protein